MLRDSEERFSPHQKGDIALDHMARYALAAMMLKGTDEVLDAASGEGYGSALLATRARRVTGLDISAEAVQHAQNAYATPNLRYLQKDVALTGLPDQFFDAVVSFETIEHLKHDRALAFLDEMKRVLRSSGYLLISTPDADVYNAGRSTPNPYHLHEFSAYDFEAALGERFRFVRMLGQSTSRFSLITSADGSPTTSFSVGRMTGQDMVLQPVIQKPMYLIAICSDAGLPPAPSVVFG